MSIADLGRQLRSRAVSAVELTGASLERIDRLNPSLNAFITVTAERALARARLADRELANGVDRGPLHGIPIAVKDLFPIAGIRFTGGSKLYADRVAESDCEVVTKLETAGAVITGTLNLHELAYGITSANPHFGAVRNPWNLEHSPGGSSGGSGAALAAGTVVGAMGSDTGGSIRVPAAFCGIVGLKPTYGRVSRRGVQPLAYTLDHMGPMARSVRDAACLFQALTGSGIETETPVPAENCAMRGVRIGVAVSWLEDLDPEVDHAVRGAMEQAATLGAELRPVSLPSLAALNAVGQIILQAEAAAMMTPHWSRRDEIGSDVLALLDLGRLIPATDYINAQRLRRQLGREFHQIWTGVDCLILPTVPVPAPRSGQTTVVLGGREEPVRPAVTRLVRPFNVLGLPALSMPCGLSAAGLPIGLQIAGPPMSEALVLRVGASLEDAGMRIPPCPIA